MIKPDTCFVIQPFDDDDYDRRYDEVLVPAIRAAGLEPYRVDRNPAADVPADEIEKGIRMARVCLADVSDNNPNVWYEVGYAFASHKRVCLIASKRSGSRPFDIRNRAVVEYEVQGDQDLRARISERLRAILEDDSITRCEGEAATLRSLRVDGRIEKSSYSGTYRLTNLEIHRPGGDGLAIISDINMQIGETVSSGWFRARGIEQNGYGYLQYVVTDPEQRQELKGVLVLHLATLGDMTGYWLAASQIEPGTIALGHARLKRVSASWPAERV
jgi:hypothetical protein